MTWNIPLFKTYTDQADVEAVTERIAAGTFWANGPEIAEFEQKLAAYHQRKYALVYNSGTSALHSLLLAHGIKGKEVIVPSFTFISTATTVLMAGGTPVFAETEPETLGLDTKDVAKRITGKTKAVIALHYGGIPSCEIFDLKKLCKEKGILLIEDNAESMGAKANGVMAGSIGDSAMLSFCQNKIISTGEGGAILTDDEHLYQKAQLLRSHGRLELQKDYFSTVDDMDYIELGYNYRMPTMCAALGIAQLEKIDQLISLRQERAAYYRKGLEKCDKITFLSAKEGVEPVHQMYTILLPSKEVRDAVQQGLESEGIMSKVYFTPCHLKTLFKERFTYKEGDLPATEKIAERVLTLPFWPHITSQEQDTVISTINNIISRGTK